MATPPLSEKKAQEVLRLRAQGGMSHVAIARELGISTGSVHNVIHKYISDKKEGEFNWRELSQWVKQGQELKKKAGWSQETATIKLGDGSRPEVLIQLGDLHIGAWGVDYGMLETITDEIKATGVWVVLIGDLLEMAIRLRNVLEVTAQVLPPEQQIQFLESWLEEILPQVAFSTWCNHGVEREEKLAGVSIIKKILSKKTVYFNGIGHPEITVGKQTYRIAASHKFRGNSMYDANHANKRYARMEAGDRELIMQGDLHRPATSMYQEGGLVRAAITSGSLYTNSGYAKRHFSLLTLPVFPCCVLRHDKHEIVPFWNLESALIYRNAFTSPSINKV